VHQIVSSPDVRRRRTYAEPRDEQVLALFHGAPSYLEQHRPGKPLSMLRARALVLALPIALIPNRCFSAGSPPVKAPLRFLAGATCIPHPSKKRGEDAYFSAPHALGVADGVGGWAELGIDAGAYARALMDGVEKSCDNALVAGKETTPLEALEEAHRGVSLQGSSTACIVTARRDGCVSVVNVGDSGVQVWKRARPPLSQAPAPLRVEEAALLWSCTHTAPMTTHGFNFPVQLAAPGGNGQSDSPRDGSLSSWELEGGELLILATDGMWDNLSEQAIRGVLARFDFSPCIKYTRVARTGYAETLRVEARLLAGDKEEVGIGEGGRGVKLETKYPLGPEPPLNLAEVSEMERVCRGQLQGMSAALAMAAIKVGNDPQADSPFALAARQAAGAGERIHRSLFHGGKLDDTTVVCALVTHDHKAIPS